ncbi:MAG TPA: tail fiber protein [Draconibacterium sp.]|nr:tail fiber protein [Draconibacterium sp.]
MEPFIGQIQAFGFNFAPRGWAKCEGQLMSIAENNALFALLGTMYGGDGRTTFGLPDLRGRNIVGVGNGPGLNPVVQGEKGGSESVFLTPANLPAHNHQVSVAVNTGAGEEATSTGFLASHASAFSDAPTPGAGLAGVSSSNTGNNQPFQNRDPYLGVNYCIALQGIFPSRS